MYIYHTYAFCSTLFQTSVDQVIRISDQNSINNNLSADRMYTSTSILELEFFDCGAANIASTDRFTPEQIVYHARTQVWHTPPLSRISGREIHPLFKQKSLILRPNYKTPLFKAKHVLFLLRKIKYHFPFFLWE